MAWSGRLKTNQRDFTDNCDSSRRIARYPAKTQSQSPTISWTTTLSLENDSTVWQTFAGIFGITRYQIAKELALTIILLAIRKMTTENQRRMVIAQRRSRRLASVEKSIDTREWRRGRESGYWKTRSTFYALQRKPHGFWMIRYGTDRPPSTSTKISKTVPSFQYLKQTCRLAAANLTDRPEPSSRRWVRLHTVCTPRQTSFTAVVRVGHGRLEFSLGRFSRLIENLGHIGEMDVCMVKWLPHDVLKLTGSSQLAPPDSHLVWGPRGYTNVR